MPFNLIGASEAAPGAGTVNIAFPNDERYNRFDTNDSIMLTQQMQYLLGVLYAAESTGARVLIRQPSRTSDLSFLKCALTSDVDPTQAFSDHLKYPVPLKVGEKLSILSVNATDEDTIVGLMLGTGAMNPGPFSIDEIIDGYSDTTITANAWSACPITWNQDLKAGTYSVVGMRASVFLGANPWTSLARLTMTGNTWRPGVPATIAEADHEQLQSQTMEPWVIWGEQGYHFEAPNALPNIEVLSPSAITDENVQLMLKRIR